MTHPAAILITRYATGERSVDDATVWALEAHLESCAACRSVLADATGPDVQVLMDQASIGIGAGIAAGPKPVPVRTGRRRVATARLWPWPATACVLVLAALGLDQISPHRPSLVLLLAPIVPLMPVAAVWNRGLDPAWELLASAARGGLGLLLRRTLATLLALLPVLTVAGLASGHSPAVWLLPCLALTVGSLLLGHLLGGVDRAALTLSGAWAVGVILPSLISRHPSAVFAADNRIWWAALTLALVATLGTRLRTLGGFVH